MHFCNFMPSAWLQIIGFHSMEKGEDKLGDEDGCRHISESMGWIRHIWWGGHVVHVEMWLPIINRTIFLGQHFYAYIWGLSVLKKSFRVEITGNSSVIEYLLRMYKAWFRPSSLEKSRGWYGGKCKEFIENSWCVCKPVLAWDILLLRYKMDNVIIKMFSLKFRSFWKQIDNRKKFPSTTSSTGRCLRGITAIRSFW